MGISLLLTQAASGWQWCSRACHFCRQV